MSIPIKVLLLEDRASDAELMLYELRRAGFSVDSLRVETGEDYLAQLEPVWDLILADYSLPQFDALRALDLLQARNLDIPFIIVSANIGEDIAVSAMQRGAADYLLKDRLARLGQAVSHALKRQKQRQEKRQAEKALQESETRYRLLFEGNPLPMWVYDLKTLEFLAINGAAVAHYGYTQAEFLGMTIKDIHPETEAERLLNPVTCSAKQENPTGVWQHQKKDGALIDVEITSHEVSFDDRLARLVLANDITERKRAEEDRLRLQTVLAKSALKWQKTFDAIELPVLILDAKGRIKRSNNAARQMIGNGPVIGREIERLDSCPIWQAAAQLAHLTRVTRTSDTCQAHDKSTGRTWDLAASIATGVEDDEERIILVIHEITRMMELQASLHRSETMALLGTLVSGVAHEVRNPLFAISSTLDAFEARFGSLEGCQTYTSILRGEVNRLNGLMKDLLEYGRPLNRQLNPGSIQNVIVQAIHSCKPLADRGEVKIISQLEANLPQISMDANRLVQVFLNLLENAIQHVPAGGIVRVESEVRLQYTRHWVDCTVKDHGPGFQEDDLPRLFEPFFTRRHGGTGLGLSIVQKIVEEHGGKISAENLPEGGASVSVRLPAVTGS